MYLFDSYFVQYSRVEGCEMNGCLLGELVSYEAASTENENFKTHLPANDVASSDPLFLESDPKHHHRSFLRSA